MPFADKLKVQEVKDEIFYSSKAKDTIYIFPKKKTYIYVETNWNIILYETISKYHVAIHKLKSYFYKGSSMSYQVYHMSYDCFYKYRQKEKG